MKFVTKPQNIEIKETESALFVLFYCILCVYFFHLKHKQKFIIITTKGSIQFQSNINDRQIYEKLKWFVIVCVYEIDFVMVNAFWSIKKIPYELNSIEKWILFFIIIIKNNNNISSLFASASQTNSRTIVLQWTSN